MYNEGAKPVEYKEPSWVKFLIIPRIILFPIMLLVRLFRWTYYYKD